MSDVLKVGSRSPEVGNWQRFLNDRAVGDWQELPLVEDEAYGQRTDSATRRWQVLEGIEPTGQVSAAERARAREQGFVPFVQARGYTPVYPGRRVVDVLVVHTMENAETPDAAESVALWFAGRTRFPPPKASAHYCVDPDSVVQCVREADVAWHAPGANHNGIGLEHAGRASQTNAGWRDDASLAILRRSSELAARIARRHQIPAVLLGADDLRAGMRGFCGHDAVTKAFPGPGRTHWDPGPAFPWTDYLRLVEARLAG